MILGLLQKCWAIFSEAISHAKFTYLYSYLSYDMARQ